MFVRENKRFLLFFCFVLTAWAGFYKLNAQVPVKQPIINEQALEDWAQTKETEFDSDEITTFIEYYSQHPLNVNSATEEELHRIPFLNDMQIYNLFAYRNIFGNLLSIYELQCIEGFTPGDIENILPFIYVGTVRFGYGKIFSYSAGKHSRQFSVFYQRGIEKQSAYVTPSDTSENKKSKSAYLGSPDKICVRFHSALNAQCRIGFTAEKDAGEEFFKGSQQNGFDFYSGFVALEKAGIVQSFVVGDYQLQFGQGLTLGSGFSLGKSPDIFSVKKFHRGVYPSTSTNEIRFFRGIASSVSLHKLEITAFASFRNKDARLTDDTSQTENEYSSLIETGYHRSINELKTRNALKETLYGGRLTLKGSLFKTGITIYTSRYDKNPANNDDPYRYYHAQSGERTFVGWDYDVMYRNVNIFGEISTNGKGTYAGIAGINSRIVDWINFSAVYRNYPPGYQNEHGNAFSESTSCANEKGIFTGMQIPINSHWNVSGYADFFSFPWLKYLVNAPTHGNEYLIRLEYFPDNKQGFYLQYRIKNTEVNLTTNKHLITPVALKERSSYRLYFQYSLLPELTIKTRIEYVTTLCYNENKKEGLVIYPMLMYANEMYKWTACSGYGLFDTESYNERIYIYENDVPYSFSIPSLYGKGSRFFILLKYSFTNNIKGYFKYSRSFFTRVPGSGSDEGSIYSPHKSEVKVLLQINL
ncbi:MAG: helix-hairpin-helix domain-containing protein [Lentimicrobiaceae bacterium]|nr:helix-hairpin-helix domain-containing protein [Lentimicrobiaceae bacterium]